MINNVFIIRSVAMRNKLGVRMAEIADKVEGRAMLWRRLLKNSR